MTRPRRRPWIWFGLVVLLLAGASGAIAWVRSTHTPPDLPMATVHKGEFLVLVHTRGELVARHAVELSAPREVSDLTIVFLAPPGSEVTPGQVVIRFDSSRAQQQLQQQTAALNQAQSALDQAVAQARITGEQDKLDLDQAKYDVERAKLEASKQAIVSAIQGEESHIDLGIAEEKLKVEESAIALHKTSDEAKMASATRLRDQQAHEVAITKKQLEEMEIRSPIRGVTSYHNNYSNGWANAQPFKAGDHVWPSAIIGEIPDLSTLAMESRLDEVDRGKVSPGSAVLVHVDALPEKTFPAKLDAVSPLTEQSFTDWPPTRSFKAYASVASADPRLRPGMNAAADFVVTRIPDALSIPAKALFVRDGKPVVYLKTPRGYEPRFIDVQARNTDEAAIRGIAAGSRVALEDPSKTGARP